MLKGGTLGTLRFAVAALLLAGAAQVAGTQTASRFRDSVDGAFDISGWLLASQGGFVPLAVPITEPALDYGAAAGIVYFHPRTASPGGRRTPPDLSAVGGFYTGSRSWGAFFGHRGFWRDDRVHYTGGLGYVELNLDYYGASGRLDPPIAYTLRALPLVQEISLRMAGTDIFVGARYIFMKSTVDLTLPIPGPGGDNGSHDATMSGLGPVLSFDSRDNIFTPTRGVRADLSYLWFDEALGSDVGFGRGKFAALGYQPLGNRLIGAIRLDLQSAHGDAPFYALPFVQLRGVPAMRYQDKHVLVAEGEATWRVHGRWSVVGFGGLGWTAETLDQLSSDDGPWNAGGGFRYFIARHFGLHMGIDVARGPEEWAFYVVFGNGWRL